MIRTVLHSLPFNSCSSPLRLRTATPIRSASGSVPTTISASFASARAVAIASAAGSSGFGDLTVGKSPEGTICSSTVRTLLNPALASAGIIALNDVPWIGV